MNAPMGHPLVGARLKLERAYEHMECLRRERDRFLLPPTKNYGIFLQPEPDGDKKIVRVHLRRGPPPEWGPVVGDIVHNLRSTLDHVAWQLACLEGSPPTGTAFPVFADRRRFFKTDKAGSPDRRSGLFKIAGIGATGRALIEWAQPFNRRNNPTEAPLCMLEELWNADKHRTLPLATSSLNERGYGYRVKTPGGRLRDFEFGPFGLLHEGAQVAWFRLASDSVRPVEIDVTLTYTVCFGEITDQRGELLPSVGKPLMRTLEAMARAVGSVLRRAQLCFEEELLWPVKLTDAESLDQLLEMFPGPDAQLAPGPPPLLEGRPSDTPTT